MSDFLVCFNAIVPVFLVIVLGYGCKRAGLLRESDVPGMNRVVFRVFMFLMAFYNVYASDVTSAIRPRLMVFTVAAIAAFYALSWLYARFFVPDRDRKGVVIQGLFRSNYLVIGLPLAAGLMTGQDIGAVAVLGAVVVPMFNFLAVVTLEVYGGKKLPPLRLALDVLKNPLLLGSLLGLAFLLTGIRLPAVLETTVKQCAAVASPMMLFLLGAFFHAGTFRNHPRELTAVCLGRLVIVPALGLTAAALLGFRGVEFVALLSLFATSTAVASFTMVQQMGGDAELAGDIVVLDTALCIVTFFLWSFLFKRLGMF